MSSGEKGDLAEVAVLGGGHGAVAAAGDLAARGFRVRLALRNRERFRALFEGRRVTLEGAIEATGDIETVTDDHAAAAAGAQLVVIPLPAPAQPSVIDAIAPVLEPGQVILIAKGTFSAFAAGRQLERAGVTGVAVAEVPTLPYGVRVSGEASVRLALVAENLPLGVYPARATSEAAELIRAAYPAAQPVEDSLSSTLCNIDPSLHAPLVCMNAGSIEGLESFDIHVQGSTPAVIAASVALDEERIALREALGYAPPHWPLRDFYAGGATFYGANTRSETMDASVWKEKIDFTHRYVEEDIGCGLVLWSSLGALLDVPTPLTNALLTLVEPIVGRDVRREGLTLERLGLEGVALDELREMLREGGAEPVLEASV